MQNHYYFFILVNINLFLLFFRKKIRYIRLLTVKPTKAGCSNCKSLLQGDR